MVIISLAEFQLHTGSSVSDHSLSSKASHDIYVPLNRILFTSGLLPADLNQASQIQVFGDGWTD